MIGLLLGLVLTIPKEYSLAETTHTNHAVVLVVKSGCDPCKRLVRDLLPLLAEVGFLYDSKLIIISISREPQLARQFMGVAPHMQRIPCMIVFRKKEGVYYGWRQFGYEGYKELSVWLHGVKRWHPSREVEKNGK